MPKAFVGTLPGRDGSLNGPWKKWSPSFSLGSQRKTKRWKEGVSGGGNGKASCAWRPADGLEWPEIKGEGAAAGTGRREKLGDYTWAWRERAQVGTQQGFKQRSPQVGLPCRGRTGMHWSSGGVSTLRAGQGSMKGQTEALASRMKRGRGLARENRRAMWGQPKPLEMPLWFLT